MATLSKKPANVFAPTLSRRQFIKAGGALAVGFSFVGPGLLQADTAKPSLTKNSLDHKLDVVVARNLCRDCLRLRKQADSRSTAKRSRATAHERSFA